MATISIESPRQHEVLELLAGSAEFASSLYPPESTFLLTVDELEAPGVSFYVARDDTGRAVGIGALVLIDERTAELKRMFVRQDARGHGVATALLERIESDAAARGIRDLVLETGTLHIAAQALYRMNGYAEVPLFGQYVGEEFSVCFAKTTSPAAGGGPSGGAARA